MDETITLADSGSLADEIAKLGVTIDQARALTSAVEPVFPTTMLKEGQQFTVTLERQLDFYGQDAIVPVRLSFSPGPNEEIVVEADEDGRFIARIDGAKEGTRSRYAESPYYRARAKVGAGLYSTAKDNGVPDYIVTQMMQVFAYDVDFQRQVNATDTFEIFYGNPLTGSSAKRKVVHYTSLTVGGETKTYFRFTTSDGETGYYDINGRSADRSLLHTGAGFTPPYGTPLKAAGDGVVTVAGWQVAFGKVVRIRHKSNYETVYAHMSRIPTTIKPGVAVRQGQVIGFVGSTGRSTGYRQLVGKNLAAFRQHMQRIVAIMKAAPSATVTSEGLRQCLDGRYPALCNHHILTAADLSAVKTAEYRANLRQCLDGRYPALCNHHILTAADLSAVKTAEYRANLRHCLDGRYPALCNHSILTANDLAAVKAAEQKADQQISSSYGGVATQSGLVPGYGCAENGSCYGDVNSLTGRAKTGYVKGYYRKDGTYVRNHYRSKPR